MGPFEICRLTAIPNRRNLRHVTKKSHTHAHTYNMFTYLLRYLPYNIRKYRYTGIQGRPYTFGGPVQRLTGDPLGPRSRGRFAPPREAEGLAGGGCREGSPPPATGVRGYNPRKFFDILQSKSCILVHFKERNSKRVNC
jgi:hypothetical protein